MSRSVRYNFILIVVALSGCLAAFGGWRFAKASAPVNGPIVLISVDALRADRVGAYGYGTGRTPALDALATDGVLFERAYSHVPQTLPAHAALLTGRLPFETGVRDVAGFTVPPSSRTIAKLLRDRGYATGGIVSSFLLRKDTGIDQGFTFFDDERPVPAATATENTLVRGAAESEAVAENWLESVGTSRVFMFLHLTDSPGAGAPEGLTADYDARVTELDAVVGKLVKYLKSHQLYDRSTIMLVADHGEGLGDHGERGHGLLAYEELLRVPLIVKQPAGESAGLRVSTPVQLIDVVPTILDLAKAPGASGLRGRSLMPLLAGRSAADTPIYAESMFGSYRFGWAPITSVISGQYQLIASGTATQLFDLSVGAAERQDLSASKPDVLLALRKQLDAFTIQKSPQEPGAVTPADRERFEALGYVGAPGAPSTPETSSVLPGDRAAFVEAFRAAVQMSRTSDGKSAVDAFLALSREEPGLTDVWLHLARVAARHERHDVALEAFHRALELEPANTAGHLGAAASNLRIRKFDDAEVQAQAVLLAPSAEPVQQAEAHEIIARVALSRKEFETARTEADAAELADPKRPVRAFVDGRIALEQGQFPEAVEAFQKALDAATQAGRVPLADLRVHAAEALAQTGRHDDAEALLTAELAAFPANARARAALQGLVRAAERSRKNAAAQTQH